MPRARFAVPLALTLALVAGAAAAVEPPPVEIERTTAELLRVRVDGGVRASGYNLYRDGAYLTTARPPLGAGAFPVRAGARGGSFCVVAFEESGAGTDYSRCSASVAIGAGDPAEPDAVPSGPPSAPANLRSVVYSRGVAELFWDAATDDGRVRGYRVSRDGESVLETNGRSLFQPGLDAERRYLYEVVAIDDDGEEGAAAALQLVPVAGGTPPPPVAEGERPAAPTRFRGTAYSPGVLETFWDASPDESRLAGYALSRDGEPIAFIRGRSVFESELEPGRRYDYELVAVGRNGVRSEALSLSLATDFPRRPASGRALYIDPERTTLVEGEASGLDVTLRFRRSVEDRRPLALSLLDERGGAIEDIAVRFEPAELAGEANTARLNLSLPIAMAPRLPERRTVLLRVDDGERVVDTPIDIDIEPTAAPDVYLLIGQSNMEGYAEKGSKRAGAGEPDEPLARLRQLHVRANNARFFPTAADYTDEASNFAEPLFIRAEDPLHDRLWPGRPAKSGDFVGASLTFGKAALADTSREVYLVPAAWGGTGFCANANGARAWNAAPTDDPALGGTLLLDRALMRLDVALRESGGILRGILWHQGGADSNDPRCAAAYEENLVAMVERLRGEARPDARGEAARGPGAPVPFVAATQSRGFDERGDYSVYNPYKARVDAVHRQLAELLPHADVVINDDLVPPAYPCGQSSCVHFGAAALREQGVRFHAALERIRARHAAARALATSANDGAP